MAPSGKAKGLRIPFQIKVAATTGLVLCLLVAVTSMTLYRLASRRIIEEFGQKLITVVVNGAQNIDGDKFAKLTKPSDMKSKTYKKIRNSLLHLRDVNSQVRLRYVYTMAPTDKPGIWRYVVDSADPSTKDFSPLNTTENFTANPAWMKTIRKPFAESNLRYYPGWGVLLSSSAPIFDSHGRPVGVLSVDASAKTVADALKIKP